MTILAEGFALEREFESRLSNDEQELLGTGKQAAEAERGVFEAERNQRDAIPEIQAEIEKAITDNNKSAEEFTKLIKMAFDMRDQYDKLALLIRQEQQNRQAEDARGHPNG